MSKIPNRFALELGVLEEFVGLRFAIARHPVARESNETAKHESDQKPDRCLAHATASVRSDRHFRRLDDGDHGKILHFLDARRLVCGKQRAVDQVPSVHFTLQSVVLEHQLRRLAILPVALEKILELAFGLPQLRALLANLPLRKRSLGGRLLLAIREVVNVHLIENVSRNLD